jgi:hypothetical protein
VLHHVIAAEAGTLRYVSKKMLGGTSLPRAGLLSRLRLLSLQVAMASGLRFKAPAIVAEVPDEMDPAELRAEARAARGAAEPQLRLADSISVTADSPRGESSAAGAG